MGQTCSLAARPGGGSPPYQVLWHAKDTKRKEFLNRRRNEWFLLSNTAIGIPNFLSNDPEYGDPVVIIPPHNPVPYIKRLIGKPGDVVRIIDKRVYINGKALKRERIDSEDIILKKRYQYGSGEIVTKEVEAKAELYYEYHGKSKYIIRNTIGENQQDPQEWTVPEGRYFVMGDNRDNSNDSTKDVGFVPRENFFGRADYIWMSWECWTCLPSFTKAGKIN